VSVASISALLVANRGEIAVRILRTARELGIRGVAVFSRDDAQSLHLRQGDDAIELPGSGPAAYLDAAELVAAAERTGCDAIHPGYGFVSENADFARLCAEHGITFVGPRPEVLALFGDKVAARALARQCGVPVMAGTDGAVTLAQAAEFLESLGAGGAVMLKAVAGGGGRGIRAVHRAADLAAAYERCQSEARRAFGNDAVYAEELVVRARHIEVQVIGDGAGGVTHLGERECSLQRRHQKLVEITPAPRLGAGLAAQLCDAAAAMAGRAGFDNVGTFEFLVDAERQTFAFIEANPRLQVEHTVTEEVTGIDLVATQLAIAAGSSLADLGLDAQPAAAPRGMALQVRVNTETIGPDGTVRPEAGTLAAFDLPAGPGIRVDTFGYVGYATNPRFDSLLAKVIAWTPRADLGEVIRRAARALREFRIEGVETNVAFLEALLADPAVAAGDLYTGLVEEHLAELLRAADHRDPRLFFTGQPGAGQWQAAAPVALGRAGAQVDQVDPLAVLVHGKTPAADGSAPPAWSPDSAAPPSDDGLAVVTSPLQGTVVTVDVQPGAAVGAGQQLLVMEAMKMEHVVSAPVSGTVRVVGVTAGDTLVAGHPMVTIEPAETGAAGAAVADELDLSAVRPDLAAVLDRHDLGLDHRRPDAVARRRATGQRTARENIDDLCDPGSFVEYGPLTIAAQRARRSLDDLIVNTPADGLPAGFATVNGAVFGRERARCAVVAYDYTVLAGTQGAMNHIKKDRIFELAGQARTPVVLFAEGGGGRSGDTDRAVGGRVMAFHLFARLSGLVPLVGITSGRCFAGNACLLGCCDVVIATADSTIGMGGPAMIEGGGLGVFRPEEVGPMSVQVPGGVVDIPVSDEAEAVAVARKYLSYFQGALPEWDCADQRELRWVVPENRLRAYDVHRAVELLADRDSVLEIRRHFGAGVVTALARVEGRPLGIIANNPLHLGGAIDSDGADKATRFMQLCDAFGLPVLYLCDTPGIMVGPEAEKTALVRHASRMFVTGANLSVPFFTIVLRKAYGLGAPAMAGGAMSVPFFTTAWPTGEFGGMGIEGAVKLGFRKELAAISDTSERRQRFDEMVAVRYEQGKAINVSTGFRIDDVIDPADSRRWVTLAMDVSHGLERHPAKRRPNIDAW
jgi:acetyl/propionyl-CoA carboxylase alpha subunit/acetyl-CoA carboxylase carboxyltransferase component